MKKEVIRAGARKFLLEMFPVIVGILLAFMINNWNENYKTRKKFTAVKSQIIEEIKNNREECRKFVTNQENNNSFFTLYKDSLEVFKSRALTFDQLPFQGVNVPNITRTAWDTAISIGANSDLPFVELQMLTWIYQMQDLYSSVQKQMIAVVYSNAMYAPELMQVNFHNLNRLNEDYITFAKKLGDAYDTYFETFPLGVEN